MAYSLPTKRETKKTKRALAEVARGYDPLDQKLSERRALTVAQLCAEYLDKAEAGAIMTRRGRLKKSSTLYTDKGRIARHIIPLLGNRSVKDIGFADVNRFLADVIAGKTKADIKTKLRGRAIVRGGRGTGARTLGLLGGIFTYAIQSGYRSDNPCVGVIKPASQRRKFRLEANDYARLGRCLAAAEANGEPWQAIGAIRLLALSGCRRGEVTDLLRAEVDGALSFCTSATPKPAKARGQLAPRLSRLSTSWDGPTAATCFRRQQSKESHSGRFRKLLNGSYRQNFPI